MKWKISLILLMSILLVMGCEKKEEPTKQSEIKNPKSSYVIIIEDGYEEIVRKELTKYGGIKTLHNKEFVYITKSQYNELSKDKGIKKLERNLIKLQN